MKYILIKKRKFSSLNIIINEYTNIKTTTKFRISITKYNQFRLYLEQKTTFQSI